MHVPKAARPLFHLLVFLLLAPPLSGGAVAFAQDHLAARPDIIYHDYCSVCHGDRGDGQSHARFSLDPVPRNFTVPKAAAELSRARMIASVTYGRPGTAMVSFRTQLSADDIESVVDYIRATFMELPGNNASESAHRNEHKASVANPSIIPQTRIGSHKIPGYGNNGPLSKINMSAIMPEKLIGNPRKGRVLYMQNCIACHGTKGDGRGPRAYFISPKPRDFLSDRSRKIYNRPILFHAIASGKTGTVMPAWSKFLSEQQLADVAEFVFQTFVHPAAAGNNVSGR